MCRRVLASEISMKPAKPPSKHSTVIQTICLLGKCTLKARASTFSPFDSILSRSLSYNKTVGLPLIWGEDISRLENNDQSYGMLVAEMGQHWIFMAVCFSSHLTTSNFEVRLLLPLN